jgi:ligand-binding SRPBCC domain-containing protein
VATFTSVQRFAFPLAAVFDFFRRPANLVAVAPPELSVQLLEAPDRLETGARTTVQIRRWGISQRIVTEVVELVENSRIVEEQLQGPFRFWRHEGQFAELDSETEVTDEITFEPPGGMLGFVLTTSRITEDLSGVFAGRVERVNEFLRQLSSQESG